MITHIAIYKCKPGTSPEKIEHFMSEVQALKDKVPGLIDIHCGANYSKWSEGYTHAFVVLAESQQALDAYRQHPDHQKVAAEIDAADAGSIGIDFEAY